MTPTSQLRFIERYTSDPSPRTLRILQQWWAVSREAKTPDGEWLDVPVEKLPSTKKLQSNYCLQCEALANELQALKQKQALRNLRDENERLGLYDPDKFCDANCSWSDHHPDCKFGAHK